MKILVWIVYAVYVVLMHQAFKRVRAEHVFYETRGEKMLHGLVTWGFEGLLVGLPGYLLHKYAPGLPSWP